MMATVPHVTSGLGLRKFQADGFLLTRVYLQSNFVSLSRNHCCNGKATMPTLRVVELPVTLNFIKLLRVAQQYFCGKLFLPATITRTSA